MDGEQKSLVERIKAHWIYGVVVTVVVSAGATFAVVDKLIVGPLQGEIVRLRSENTRTTPPLEKTNKGPSHSVWRPEDPNPDNS